MSTGMPLLGERGQHAASLPAPRRLRGQHLASRPERVFMSLLPRTLSRRRRRSAACLSVSVISGPAARAATCGTTNIALHQPTTALSIQGPAWPASNATDGNLSTRWSSAFSDPQWLEVDLGSAQSICQVVIHWE